jgi:putative peptidoglycan lipid II flippase
MGAATLMAGLTLVSRLLGLVRESLLSYYFGTSELLSAFRIAFQAPNLARRLFGEGALSSAMVPVLTRTLRERGEYESRRLVGSTLTASFLVLFVLLVLVEVVIGVWRHFQDDPALRLTAIMMPYMVLICIAAVASGVLNVRGHFAVPSSPAAPTILNVAMIAALVLGGAAGLEAAPLMDWNCGSVLVAGVIQVAATGVALQVSGFFPVWGRTWGDPQLRAIIALMAPMALGLSAVQINTLLDSLIAYIFVIDEKGERVGAAVLGYAQFLYQLPLGVFGISLATALFPVLSRKAAEGDRAGMADVFERGVRAGQFIALPSAIGLIFIATPLVATLYEHGGEFTARSTQRVAAALIFYSLGIPAYFFQHVLVRTYYALHDSRKPAKIAVCMVAFNLSLNLMLVFVMEEAGLALSTSISATVQAFWLVWGLRRLFPELTWRRLQSPMARLLFAAACMAVALIAVRFVGESMGWHKAVRLMSMLGTGIATYFAAAWLLGVEEVRSALRGRRPF